MSEDFSAIKRDLIQYYRTWDGLEEDDPDTMNEPDPDPPSEDVVNRLHEFVDQNPEHAGGLEELVKIQLLTGQQKAGVETLRKLISLPIKWKPKRIRNLKQQLRNLENQLQPQPKVARRPSVQ